MISRSLRLDRSPADVFASVARDEYAAFLDAGSGDGWDGVSVLAYDPRTVLSSRGAMVRVERRGGVTTRRADPLEALRALLAELPPGGGWGSVLIGYLGYELGGRIERLPMTRQDDLGAPDMRLVHFGTVLTHDHATGAWRLWATGGSWERQERLLRRKLETAPARSHAALPEAPPRGGWNFTRARYLEAVRRAKRHIRDGDIYQVNLSRRFTVRLERDPWEVYRELRVRNPAPYACFLKYPDLVVAGSSPELFLRVRRREVLTRPIKGTRPRGRDDAEDRRRSRELRGSAKDLAELSMIVDLERNDLGRVCRVGSVRVRDHAVVERHPTVFHTVSSVTGTLDRDKDLVDLLRATFPGGSVTGCPKIRAMEIIDELEPTTRGPYTGSMGWLGAGGDAEMNIAIRTLLARRGSFSYQVGGAIVADSDPAEEYRETEVKGAALARALSGGARR